MNETNGDRPARRSWLRKWAIPLALVWVGLAVGFLGGWLVRGIIHSPASVEGKLTVSSGEVRDVYYPRPFVKPPMLEINYVVGWLTILEERADGFKVQGDRKSVV